MDQGDHGDHNSPWWTRSVQDHRGPHSDICLMYRPGTSRIPIPSNHDPTLGMGTAQGKKRNNARRKIHRNNGWTRQPSDPAQAGHITPHRTIQAVGGPATGRDEQLGQELLKTKGQHQRELQNHERILNAMMAALEANLEARKR